MPERNTATEIHRLLTGGLISLSTVVLNSRDR